MTLPISGELSFSAVNTELQRSSTAQLGMNETDFRSLAKSPSGQVAMSSLYGRAWLPVADAVGWAVTNKNALHKWPGGGTGDVRYWNNNIGRYVTSLNWTWSSTLSGINSNWVTVVAVVVENGANNLSVSVNGGALTPTNNDLVVDIAVGGNLEIRVLQIEADVKSVTSVVSSWNLNSANAGSWPHTVVLPGRWTGSAVTGTVTLANNQIAVGGGTYGGNAPFNAITSTDSVAYHYFDGYWYNNGQMWLLINNTGTTRNVTFNNAEAYSTLLTFQEG